MFPTLCVWILIASALGLVGYFSTHPCYCSLRASTLCSVWILVLFYIKRASALSFIELIVRGAIKHLSVAASERYPTSIAHCVLPITRTIQPRWMQKSHKFPFPPWCHWYEHLWKGSVGLNHFFFAQGRLHRAFLHKYHKLFREIKPNFRKMNPGCPGVGEVQKVGILWKRNRNPKK